MLPMILPPTMQTLRTRSRRNGYRVGSGVVVCVNPVRFQVLFDPAEDFAPCVPVLFPLSQRVASGHLGYAMDLGGGWCDGVPLGGGWRRALQPSSAETTNRTAEAIATNLRGGMPPAIRPTCPRTPSLRPGQRTSSVGQAGHAPRSHLREDWAACRTRRASLMGRCQSVVAGSGSRKRGSCGTPSHIAKQVEFAVSLTPFVERLVARLPPGSPVRSRRRRRLRASRRAQTSGRQYVAAAVASTTSGMAREVAP